MCIENADFDHPEIAPPGGITLYKVVRRNFRSGKDDSFRSMFMTWARVPQVQFRQSAPSNQCQYEVGKTIASPMPGTPGLYCYRDQDAALREAGEFNGPSSGVVVLAVLVAAGTKFVAGTSPRGDNKVVCVEALTPVRVLVGGL